MEAIRLLLPKPYIKRLDQLVKGKRFPTRAEAIRIAVRELLDYEFPTRTTIRQGWEIQ